MKVCSERPRTQAADSRGRRGTAGTAEQTKCAEVKCSSAVFWASIATKGHQEEAKGFGGGWQGEANADPKLRYPALAQISSRTGNSTQQSRLLAPCPARQTLQKNQKHVEMETLQPNIAQYKIFNLRGHYQSGFF